MRFVYLHTGEQMLVHSWPYEQAQPNLPSSECCSAGTLIFSRANESNTSLLRLAVILLGHHSVRGELRTSHAVNVPQISPVLLQTGC